MSNELAPKGNTNLATTQAQQTEVIKSDLLIPKLLLMQGPSKAVAARKAIIGDIIRSTTSEKLGDDKTPAIEFIPLAMRNAWLVEEKPVGSDKFQFRKVVPRKTIVRATDVAEENAREAADKQSDTLDWTFKHLGTDWKRTKQVDVFAILVKDIQAYEAEIKRCQETGDMPDTTKVVKPVVISFRSKSYKAGRNVVDYFSNVNMMMEDFPQTKPYSCSLSLSCRLDKNDKGEYFVYEVSNTKSIAKDASLMKYAAKWYDSLVGKLETVKTHDESEADLGEETESKQF